MIRGEISACDKLGDGCVCVCVCACTSIIQRTEDKDALNIPQNTAQTFLLAA